MNKIPCLFLSFMNKNDFESVSERNKLKFNLNIDEIYKLAEHMHPDGGKESVKRAA